MTTITRRQAKEVEVTSGSSTVTTTSCSFDIPVKEGNLLIAFGMTASGNKTLSFSDDNGNIWDIAVQNNFVTNGPTVAIGYVESANNGLTSVTLTRSADTGAFYLAVMEYDGASIRNVLDVTSSGNGNGTSPSSGDIVTTEPNDLLIGGYGQSVSFSAGDVFTVDAGWTLVNELGTAAKFGKVYERLSVAKGTYDFGGSIAASRDWVALAVALKPDTRQFRFSPVLQHEVNVNPDFIDLSNPSTNHGLNDGLVLHVRFLPRLFNDESYPDFSPYKNDLTLLNVTDDLVIDFENGRWGYLNCNGSSGQSGYCPLSDSLELTELTFAGWVRVENDGILSILEKRQGTTSAWCIYSNDRAINIAGSNRGNNVAVTSVLTGSVWYYIAVTLDSSGNAKGYVNGTLSLSSTTDAPGSQPTFPVILGARWDDIGTLTLMRRFEGKLDGIRLYDRVLSASEIADLYRQELAFNPDTVARFNPISLLSYSQDVGPFASVSSVGLVNQNPDFIDLSNPIAQHGLNDGLVSWWLAIPNQMGTTTWKDLCGRNDGTLTNMDPGTDWVIDNEDGRWGSLDFDGVDDYVNITDSDQLDLSTPSTIEFWVRVNTVYGNGSIISKFTSGTDAGKHGIRTESLAGGKFYITANVTNYHDLKTYIPVDAWKHVVVVNSSSNSFCYVDGVLRSTAAAISGWMSGTFDLRFGKPVTSFFNSTDKPFNGKINGVAIYNRALSATEVQELYNESRSYYPNLLNRHRISAFTYSFNLSPPVVIPWQGNIANQNPDFIDLSNPIASHGLNDGLVSWWLAIPNQMGTTTWKDLCGRNDGTLTNMDPGTDWVIDNEDGRWGSLDFDGSNDFVNLSTGIDLTTLSFSCWVKRESSTGTFTLLAKRDGTTHGFHIFLWNPNYRVTVIDGSGTLLTDGSSTTIPINTWKHIVVTWAGSSINIYVDGEFDTSFTGSITSRPSLDMLIGARYDTAPAVNSLLNGKINDCKVYNRALSASEVQELYNESRTYYPNLLNRIPSLPFTYSENVVEVSSANDVATIPSHTPGLVNVNPDFIDLGNPVNWDHPLARHLKHLWLAIPQYNGGLEFIDLCSPVGNGTLTNMDGSAWVQLAENGQFAGLQFNGTTEYVDFSSADDLITTSTESFTCAYIARKTDSSSGTKLLNASGGVTNGYSAGLGWTNLAGRGFAIAVPTYGGVSISQKQIHVAGTPHTTFDNNWHFIGFNYPGGVDLNVDATVIRWVIDGVTYASESGIGFGASGDFYRIGGRGTTAGFPGVIACHAIWIPAIGPELLAEFEVEAEAGYPNLLNRVQPLPFTYSFDLCPPVVLPWQGNITNQNPDFIDLSNPIASHGLNDGLVGWWKVVPAITGSLLWKDLTQNNLNGNLTNMNSLDWVINNENGRWGQVDFDGTNDHIVIPSNSLHNNITQITFGGWVKTDGGSSSEQQIGGKQVGGSTRSYQLRLCDSSNNDPRFLIFSSNTAYSTIWSTTVASNTWYHVIGTYDGSVIRLYVDGILRASTVSVGTLDTETIPLVLGGLDGYQFLKGSLDDIRLYNRALSASEIQELYNESRTYYPNLLNRIQPLPFTYSFDLSPPVVVPWQDNIANQNPDFVDISNAVNKDHPLNRNLYLWYLPIPYQNGFATATVVDLCSNSNASVTKGSGSWVTSTVDWGGFSSSGGGGARFSMVLPEAYYWTIRVRGVANSTGTGTVYGRFWDCDSSAHSLTFEGSDNITFKINSNGIFANQDIGLVFGEPFDIVIAGDAYTGSIQLFNNGVLKLTSGLTYYWRSGTYTFQNIAAGNRTFDGHLSSVQFWTRRLPNDEIYRLYNEADLYYSETINRIPSLLPVAVSAVTPEVESGAYSLTVDNQSIAAAGTDASLLYARVLAVDSGAFTLAGTDVTLNKGITLVVDAGSITLAGTDTGVFYARNLEAAGRSSDITATDASVLHNRGLLADSHPSTITGDDVAALHAKVISGESGPVAVSGTESATILNRSLEVASQPVEATGEDVNTAYNRSLEAAGQPVATAGTATGLLFNRSLDVTSQPVAATGTAVGATYHRVVVGESGLLDLAGTAVTLTVAGAGSYAITAEGKGIALSPTVVAATHHRVVVGESGLLDLVGTAVTLTVVGAGSYAITADGRVIALLPTTANLLLNRQISTDSQSIVSDGTPANTILDRSLEAANQNTAVAGTAAETLFDRALEVANQSILVTGSNAIALYDRVAIGESGSTGVTGTDVGSTGNYIVTVDGKAVTSSPADAYLFHHRQISAASAEVATVETPSSTIYDRAVDAVSFAATVSGAGVSALHDRVTSGEPGAITLFATESISRTTDYIWTLEGAVPAADRVAFQTMWRDAFNNSGFPEDWANDTFEMALSASGEEPAQSYYFRTVMPQAMFYEVIVLVADSVGQSVPFDKDDDPDAIMNSSLVSQFIDDLDVNHNIQMRLRRNDRGDNEPQLSLLLSQTGLQVITSA